MSVKEVQRKFDAIDDMVPVNQSFDPVHCTNEEGCAVLAQKVFDIIHGVAEDGDD